MPPPTSSFVLPTSRTLPLHTKIIGSGLFTGYIPIASGTFGSMLALGLYWFIPEMHVWFVLTPSIALGFLIGIPIGNSLERFYGSDPSVMVWDEMVGMWVSLLLLPQTWVVSLIAFLAFRVFDIFKPPPAGYFDRQKGGFGIMMDDVIAGVYANVVAHVFLFLFP